MREGDTDGRDLRDVNEVSVRYSDARRRRSFEKQLDLDLGIYRNLMRVERSRLRSGASDKSRTALAHQ
jgi:hypothetical protein